MSDTEQHDPERRIRERAYQLWLEAGSPEGRSDEFWHRARELEHGMQEGGGAADEAHETGALESLGDAMTESSVPPHRGVP